MVKAVFFDIDGTLVSFKTHEVSLSTRIALRRLREKGIKVFIATGRPKKLMLDAVGDMEFDGYITLNGSHCFTSDHKDIYKGGIPRADIERLVAYCRNRPEEPFVFVDSEGWFITRVNADVEAVSELIEIDAPPVAAAETALEKEVLQLMGYFRESEEKELFSEVLLHCEPMRWHPLFADIIARGNNKSLGIEKVLEYYGIALKDTMAFGDGGNDIPMLEYVGIGVAMGNADNAVKEAADYVTSSVDEEGVYNALLHFGLID